jgi:hypothetical protein
MFKNKKHVLHVEITYSLKNIENWLKNNQSIKDVENIKFNEVKEIDYKAEDFDWEESHKIIDRLRFLNEHNLTFRIGVIPTAHPDVDVFYHHSMNLHSNVFDGELVSRSSLLSERDLINLEEAGVSSVKWELRNQGSIYVYVNNKLILATPSLGEKIAYLRENRSNRQSDQMRSNSDELVDVDLGGGKSTKCWLGVSRSDFACHNNLAHVRVVCPKEMGSVTVFSQKVWHGPLDTSVTLLLH